MKKFCLLIVFSLLSIFSLSDYHITRGPAVGEIYIVGPTFTDLALYRSIDFGQTIICMDSINAGNMMSITAGKSQGIIYYSNMQGSLFLSNSFGSQNSWVFKNSGIGIPLCNSENIGFVFEHAIAHSEDYGNNFTSHAGNGAFGIFKEAEKGFNDNGYFMSYKDDVFDSVYLFFTTDNFNNVELINTISIQANNIVELTRGNNFGEIYLSNLTLKHIYISYNFGVNLIKTNLLNLENGFSIMGGRQDGELYIMYNFINMMWQNAHTYILHSTDYGITFEVFHPFAKGQEPLLANFSAKSEENANGAFTIKTIDSVYYVTGDMPLDVQFYNYSIGDINSYEWDFNNDGIVDSYDENPVYTYADTGWYSVNLKVYDDYDTNSFLKENYIYVYDSVGTYISEQTKPEIINCFPNPFKDNTNISFSIPHKANVIIKVYNVLGKEVTSKALGILDKGIHNAEFSAINLKTGIYYYSLLVNGKTAGVRKMVKVE
ncbi:MAG: T9SS type A sorting domain-containing protein [Bacteroidales bacterium]|nr:T9SS type A sorting domain-containing protein [Bacteroidales bacterium]